MDEKFLIDLRPGIAGYIVDGRIQDKEVIATIIDYIIKGYIDYYPQNNNWNECRLRNNG